MRLSLPAFAAVSILLIVTPLSAFAQNNQAFDVTKAKGSEAFTLSHDATNRSIKDPIVYTFDQPKGPNWLLDIRNSLAYTSTNGSKTVIKLQEPAPSKKYVEIVMFGGNSKKFFVSVNTPDTGYYRIYDGDLGPWSTDNPVHLEHDNNGGLSVTDGKRTVVSELNMQGFLIGSIQVYGNDEAGSTVQNANGGDISFQLVYGDISQSPIYYLPAAIMAGIGGLIGALLIFKKRKSD